MKLNSKALFVLIIILYDISVKVINQRFSSTWTLSCFILHNIGYYFSTFMEYGIAIWCENITIFHAFCFFFLNFVLKLKFISSFSSHSDVFQPGLWHKLHWLNSLVTDKEYYIEFKLYKTNKISWGLICNTIEYITKNSHQHKYVS